VDAKESEELNVIVDHERIMGLWRRALEQNPEYLFTRQADWMRDLPAFIRGYFEKCFEIDAFRKLADEKKNLLNLLKDPVKKIGAAKRIKEINGELFAGYDEVLKALEQGLLDAQAVKETQEVLAFREYPFFCFGEEIFLDMKEKVKQAFADGSK